MKSRAFTLIELLVVVLIIGILSAIALPQYQKAVYKARFATLKNLTRGIAQAQEIFYLENNAYATDFADLSIDLPSGKLNSSTKTRYVYDWGWCKQWGSSSVACHNDMIKMRYQIYYQYGGDEYSKGSTLCVSDVTDTNDIRNQICKAETGATTGSEIGGVVVWRYQ